jgi:hypothetical protein
VLCSLARGARGAAAIADPAGVRGNPATPRFHAPDDHPGRRPGLRVLPDPPLVQSLWRLPLPGGVPQRAASVFQPTQPYRLG